MRLAAHVRVEIMNLPGSGKEVSEGDGVYREMGFEGSWMREQCVCNLKSNN